MEVYSASKLIPVLWSSFGVSPQWAFTDISVSFHFKSLPPFTCMQGRHPPEVWKLSQQSLEPLKDWLQQSLHGCSLLQTRRAQTEFNLPPSLSIICEFLTICLLQISCWFHRYSLLLNRSCSRSLQLYCKCVWKCCDAGTARPHTALCLANTHAAPTQANMLFPFPHTGISGSLSGKQDLKTSKVAATHYSKTTREVFYKLR